MTTNADLAAQVSALAEGVKAAEKALVLETEALESERAETERQNVLRDRRIKWSRIATVLSLVIGLLAALVGLYAKATADDIVEARRLGRLATCDGFQAFTNALVNTNTPETAEEYERLVAVVPRFEADLERRLEALGCDIVIEIPPAPAVPVTIP